MTMRNEAAWILVALGSAGLFATAAFHLRDYWKDSLSAASLSPHMQAIFRVMHLLVGWQWIVIAIIVLLAALTDAKLSWALIMFCGAAILVEAGVTLSLMGLFMGTKLLGLAGILIISGGLLFRNA
jgi:hypothetical protein